MRNLSADQVIKLFTIALLILPTQGFAQFEDFNTVKARIDFGTLINEWNGFGVNYVQTAHTRDFAEYPQEYGGFSLLTDDQKDEIIELIFGEDGLKPGVVKMFLDPLHQKEPNGPFDHETTTKYMMEFVQRGLAKTRSWGGDLEVITTLYGPPAWATQQKELRGRDLDYNYKKELGIYMIDWAKYLKDQGIPINYISLHNEGEDWRRWAADGKYANFDHGHDYNMYWRPEEVADFIAFMPKQMEEAGLEGVSITPGECSRWYQFDYSGYARAIYENPEALKSVGLLTAHNFYRNLPGGHRWWAGSNNHGSYLLQQARPDLKSWVTSASWGSRVTTIDFVWQLYMNIYQARVNAYIPWACIQRTTNWPGGDPNKATAIKVQEDGSYEILNGYYYYKQVSRAGQPGMSVADVMSMDSELTMIGFGSNGTDNPDAFIVVNNGISVTNRADAVDVFINGKKYHISTKDQDANNNFEGEVTAVAIETGYLVELAIPLSDVKRHQNSEALDFDIRLTEGAYSIAGRMIWDENGKILLDKHSKQNGSFVHIPKTESEITVDGQVESAWDNVQSVSISEDIHPNNPEDFGGNWKACYDDSVLYVMVEVSDETNLQGRKVAIELKGTNYTSFEAFRSIDNSDHLYHSLGTFDTEDGQIIYEVPSKSVTTFFGIK